MEKYSVYVWLAFIVLTAIGEGATAQLVGIWFAIGGVGGLIAALCGAQFWVQLVITVVISTLLLLFTRPIVAKYLTPKKISTNADRVVGGTAIVTQEINNLLSTGQAHIGGTDWTARSAEDIVIPAGCKVTVERIDGVKLIVHPQQPEESAG